MESFEDYMKRRQDRLDGVEKPKKQRQGLRPVSKKQQKKNQSYAKARERHYADEANRVCAICGTTNNLSIHHSEKRGDNTDKEETFISLCVIGSRFNELYPELNSNEGLGCHQGIERNKGWARERGYLK